MIFNLHTTSVADREHHFLFQTSGNRRSSCMRDYNSRGEAQSPAVSTSISPKEASAQSLASDGHPSKEAQSPASGNTRMSETHALPFSPRLQPSGLSHCACLSAQSYCKYQLPLFFSPSRCTIPCCVHCSTPHPCSPENSQKDPAFARNPVAASDFHVPPAVGLSR